MQIVRSIEPEHAVAVGLSARVLLLSTEGEFGQTARRLAGLGGRVDVVEELFLALSEVIDDPSGYALLVIDCDSAQVGGLDAAQRAIQLMGGISHRVPVVLISKECTEQRFPMDRSRPVVLRAPLSAVSLKVGFEHALRDRLLYREIAA